MAWDSDDSVAAAWAPPWVLLCHALLPRPTLPALQHEGQKLLIGTYRTEEEAARAWDRTAIHLRGPNTQTNFPAAEYLGAAGPRAEGGRRCRHCLLGS